MGAHTPAADVRAVMDSLRRIVHALHTASRWSQSHVGLSAAQLFVLHVLAESPGLSLNDLAGRTHTHQSSVSTVVSRLVAGGLVSRERSTTDSRRIALRLTPKGRRTATGAPDPVQRRLIGGVERLPAARRRMLADTLDDLTDTLQPDRGAPAMFFQGRRA